MARHGNPYDNAKAESFMKTLKVEEVYLMEYDTFEDVVASRAWIAEPCHVRRGARPAGWSNPRPDAFHPQGCTPDHAQPVNYFHADPQARSSTSPTERGPTLCGTTARWWPVSECRHRGRPAVPNGDVWDVALRYAGEFSSFRVAAGAGYGCGVITDAGG